MAVHTGSVGASGSSPALCPATTYIWWHPQRGWIAFPRCMYCGRPSSRPYSCAVGCAVICNALSIIIHTGNVGASGSSPALCPPMTYMLRHPLAGIFCISAWFVLRATFQSPLQLRGGLRGDFQCIINNSPCRQCRGEWKLARVAVADACTCWAVSPEGMICVFAWFVLRATFQSPLQLRGGALG